MKEFQSLAAFDRKSKHQWRESVKNLKNWLLWVRDGIESDEGTYFDVPEQFRHPDAPANM